MTYKAGFIGAGNMGGALASAVYKVAQNIAVCDFDKAKTDALAASMPSIAVVDADTVAKESRFVFLGVKPDAIGKVAEKIAPCLSADTVVVTMAAGVSLQDICAAAKTDRCIRIMPNTPVAAQQGMILYCVGKGVSAEDEAEFLALLSGAGIVDKIDEKFIDAAAALSGCGPAFVYIFTEALAEGAVKCGLPRDKALLYAKQTVFGSAAMMLGSDKHPERLKDEVCSPGGTTIEGVLALEKGAFRATAASAVTAAFEKTAKLKK